jgi:hypothetical protein
VASGFGESDSDLLTKLSGSPWLHGPFRLEPAGRRWLSLDASEAMVVHRNRPITKIPRSAQQDRMRSPQNTGIRLSVVLEVIRLRVAQICHPEWR